MPTRRKIAQSIVLVVAIASLFSIWYLTAHKEGGGTVIEKPANVKSIEIIILESFPVQVNVIVHGELPDSCTEISDIATKQESFTFIVTITTRRPSDAVCAQVITPFERTISLEVIGLKKGVYTVDVNGASGTFELQVDNILQDAGFLEGKVEIGPLCPVEPCNLTQDQIAQAYDARKIVIYTSDRSSIVTIVSLDPTGNYKINLSPGKYVVDINRIGMDRSDEIPKEITIEPGKTVILDIRIDTGLR